MKLDNQTERSACLLRTVIDEERFMASVVVRVTYRLEGQRLVVHDEQPWEVKEQAQQTPHGVLEPELPFRRGGVDLFVFGHAFAPERRKTKAMELSLRAGDFERRVLVVGDRLWHRALGELVASDPVPFETMPLGPERAYGGQTQWDGATIPFGGNPQGRGYYVEEKTAVDQPLPNLELPHARITRWNDQPEPAGLGLCPATNGLRLRNSLQIDDQGGIKELRPTAFNCAFPRMIAPAIEPGTPMQITGVDPRGPLSFTLPAPALLVKLRFGDEHVERVPFIDQIGIEADLHRVFITYRYPFRYVLVPKQRRSCTLVEDPAPAGRAAPAPSP